MTSFATLLAVLAFTALLGGWLALRRATRTRYKAGLPSGRVVYADTGDWRSPDKPFFSAKYGLAGKPDYVVETRAGLIPIEVKSRSAPPEPYASHVLQLVTYCLLVEESENQAPPYGIIRYADAAFEIDYTPTLRRDLLTLLDEMRRASRGSARRNHEEPRRCAGCGYRSMCNQSLI